MMMVANEEKDDKNEGEETRQGMIDDSLVEIKRFVSLRFPPTQSNGLFIEFRERDRRQQHISTLESFSIETINCFSA